MFSTRVSNMVDYFMKSVLVLATFLTMSLLVACNNSAAEAVDQAEESGSKSDKVKAVCEAKFDANKDDCSKFVRAVSKDLGIDLKGTADEIVETMEKSSDWTKLANGTKAAEEAKAGKFVVGGLKGAAHNPARDHGHVVVVVEGPLAHSKYPSAYWGSLGGPSGRNKTVNYAWKADRDSVTYYAREW